MINTAIDEARRIFGRITSYTIYRVALTMDIMFLVVLSSIFLGFQPLTAVMIVVMSLLDDVPIMAIAYDNTPVAEKPIRWEMQRLLGISAFLGFFSIVQSFGLLLVGAEVITHPAHSGWFGLTTDAQLQSVMFLQLVAGGHLLLFSTRTHRWGLSFRCERFIGQTGEIMNRRIVQVAVLTFLLMTRVSPGFSQTSSELKNFLSQKMGQSQDQIVAIEHGQPFAKEIEPRSPAEIFVVGVIYINALPESYVRFFGDFNRLRHIPFPEYMAVSEFSGSPRLSDLQGFGFGSDDVKALRDCTSEKCAIQIPSSANMDELRKSVNWSAPNVDEEVNQLLQKLALSRMLEYQKEGNRIFGAVYNDRGQRVNVADQFKHMIEYYRVLVQDLPDFYHYILDYPNAKLANVEDTFRWERVDFGLKPTLRIVHILTMHGEKPDQPAYVIAEKQLYASHYFETALDITFLIRGSDDPKEPGFYLVKAIGCEQAMLTGLTGAATRRIAVDRSLSDLKRSLAYVKDALEHQR